MQTYILRGKWESTRRAKDLDHLRKWLAGLYNGDKNPNIDVEVITKDGNKRFVGKFGIYRGKPVWYPKIPAPVNKCLPIDKKTGKLIIGVWE